MKKRKTFYHNIFVIIFCILSIWQTSCAMDKEAEASVPVITPKAEIHVNESTNEPTSEPTLEPIPTPVPKPTPEPVQELSPLHVEGASLVNEKGEAALLRGVSTHGIAWYPQYVNQDFFYELRNQWNADVVRLAVYTAEDNGYCNGGNQEELKKLIKEGVSYAKEAGLYVIIDWHVLRECNPHVYKEEAKRFFDEMSKEFSKEEHVLYEICNEPNGGVSWEEIKAYANEVIPVIRANDEDAIIIVGTPNWSQDVDVAAHNPIEGEHNIMYALHFYAATHREELRKKAECAIEEGLPIMVTEFGICDASGNGAIDTAQADEWCSFLQKNNISFLAWNLSNKNESSAVFLPECEKTAGFTTADLTPSGTWVYQMLKDK